MSLQTLYKTAFNYFEIAFPQLYCNQLIASGDAFLQVSLAIHPLGAVILILRFFSAKYSMCSEQTAGETTQRWQKISPNDIQRAPKDKESIKVLLAYNG